MPPNVKVCLSSRPLHDFVSAFKSCSSLRLQDLTFGDIKQYVDDELEASEHMRVLQLQNPEEAPKLALEIVNKSDGVFLWVKLVVVSLLRGLQNSDEICDLQRRIRLLPPSLGDLFYHILGKLEPVYLQQSSRIFQIFAQAQQNEFSLSSLELFFAKNQDWKMLTLPVARPLSEKDLIIRCDIVNTWLQTRCGGLIKVHCDLKRYRRYNARLSYLHRTVLDFLKLPEINSRILAGTAGTAFSPAQALLQSSVLYIKWVMYRGLETKHSVSASHPAVYFAEQGLRYAFLAELETKKAQTLMLEELDRVCNALLRGSVGPPYCWANERIYGEDSYDIDGDMSTITQPTLQKFKNHHDSLLTIAIASGLYLYVFKKIQLEPNLVTAKRGRPLLHYAVQQFDTYHNLSSFCYSEEIIELLLSHGASPNQTYKGKSAWERILEAIFELLRELNTPLSDLLIWIRIARLFLLHGTNMVQCIENDLNKSAHQIITAVFYDQLPEETRDLQRMLVSSSQIKEMGLQRPTPSPHASSSSSHGRESLDIQDQQSWRKCYCKVIFRVPPANSQCSLQNEMRKVQVTRLKEIEMQPLRPASSWVPEPQNEQIGMPEATRQSPNEQKARMQLPKLVTQFPEQKEQPRAEAQQLSLSRIFKLISVD